jgi:putative membrane protein
VSDLWTTWHADPLMLAGLGLTSSAYALGLGRLWRRAGMGRGVGTRQAVAFSSGIGVLVLASMSPIHELAERLFWGHMVQHLLLILVAAPLLVLGSPHVAWLWAFDRRTRRKIGRWWTNARSLQALAKLATIPLVAWSVHAVILWSWHLPAAYQLALGNTAMHSIEHLCFLLSAILFWWVLLRPAAHPRLNGGMRVLYLVTASMQSGLLGALLTFAGAPLYPIQSAGATGLGFSPLEDQQLAGLIMWLPGGMIYLLVAAQMFVTWMGDEETRRPISEVPVAIPEY